MCSTLPRHVHLGFRVASQHAHTMLHGRMYRQSIPVNFFSSSKGGPAFDPSPSRACFSSLTVFAAIMRPLTPPECGPCRFRNSGIMLGKKIMVAVRTTLKLEAPVAVGGVRLVTRPHVDALCTLANGKFAENAERTQRFFATLRARLEAAVLPVPARPGKKAAARKERRPPKVRQGAQGSQGSAGGVGGEEGNQGSAAGVGGEAAPCPMRQGQGLVPGKNLLISQARPQPAPPALQVGDSGGPGRGVAQVFSLV